MCLCHCFPANGQEIDDPDDKIIREMERKLGLKKKKKKQGKSATLDKGFEEAGLDYLLGYLDDAPTQPNDDTDAPPQEREDDRIIKVSSTPVL